MRLYRFLALAIVLGAFALPLARPAAAQDGNQPDAIEALPFQAGFPDSEPYGSFLVSPSVVDLNGDGKLEVLTADSTGCVWGWDRAGKELPGFPWKTGGVCDNAPRINGSLAIADINNDGKLEVVAGTRGSGTNAGKRGKVYVWNRDGVLMSGWPKEMTWANIDNGNFPEIRSVALANVSGDSRLEVLAATTNEAGSDGSYAPNVYAWDSSGNKLAGFPASSLKGSGIFGHISAGDLNGDGKAEIVVGRDEIYAYAYKGDGAPLSGWPVRTYVDIGKQTWGTDKYMEFTRSGPAVGDLDGDGTQEVVIAGKVRDPQANHSQSNSALLVLEPDGSRRSGWSVAKLVGAPLQTEYTPNNPVALADFDNNGTLEIVVTYDDGTIRAYRENGSQLWSYNYAQGKKLFASEVAIGDITGDGLVDIVFGTYSFDPAANDAVRLYALTTSGQVVPSFPIGLPSEGATSPVKGIQAGPTLADLDGDGGVEIIAHSRGGVLYVWDLPGRYRADRMPWPTSRQNNRRSAGS